MKLFQKKPPPDPQESLRRANTRLTLPGEPMIYCIKYSLKNQAHCLSLTRDLKWKSLIQRTFRNFIQIETPVVIFIQFFVTPPKEKTRLKNNKFSKAENAPAVDSFELCDYLLHLLESLKKVAISGYQQVVKIDVEKRYSKKDPRTTIQIMNWDEYQTLKSKNKLHAQSKSVCAPVEVRGVQPQL